MGRYEYQAQEGLINQDESRALEQELLVELAVLVGRLIETEMATTTTEMLLVLQRILLTHPRMHLVHLRMLLVPPKTQKCHPFLVGAQVLMLPRLCLEEVLGLQRGMILTQEAVSCVLTRLVRAALALRPEPQVPHVFDNYGFPIRRKA